MWHLAYSEGVQEEGPGARHSHSALVHDQAMWVFGGMCDLQPRNDFWKWSFGKNLDPTGGYFNHWILFIFSPTVKLRL